MEAAVGIWVGGWAGGVGFLAIAGALARVVMVFSREESRPWRAESSLEGGCEGVATRRMALTRGSFRKWERMWALASISGLFLACLVGCMPLRYAMERPKTSTRAMCPRGNSFLSCSPGWGRKDGRGVWLDMVV